MGYQVKWVEENLGVTRKALRIFEEKGLMQKKKWVNRDYTDEDIEKIWLIRVFQGMGYTLNEIVNIFNSENYDFQTSISKKIEELERIITDKQKHLQYAKNIKLTGRLPVWPKEMGSVTFEEFYNNAVNNWSKTDSLGGSLAKYITNNNVDLSENNHNQNDLYSMIKLIDDNNISVEQYSTLLLTQKYLDAISDKFELGADNAEVQVLVKLYYESTNRFAETAIPREHFGRLMSSAFVEGDVSSIYKNRYGLIKCEFIANAIAIFGGYKNYIDTLT